MNRTKPLLGILTALALASCDDGTGPNISSIPGYAINKIFVSPTAQVIFVPDTIRPGDRATFSAISLGKGGSLVNVDRYAWSSSDESIATVDSAGVVTPRGYGTVIISASAHKIGSARLDILPATDTVLVSPKVDTVLVGDPMVPRRDTARLVAEAFDASGTKLTGVRFEWSSSAAGAVDVDTTGLARALTPGTSTVSATSHGLHGGASIVALEAVATLTVAPTLDSIYVDEPIVPARDTMRLVATARDPFGLLLTNVPYTWQPSGSGTVTVDGTGLVRAASLGVATVTVSAQSQSAASVVHVVPLVASVEVTSPVSEVLALDTVQLSATARGYTGAVMQRTFNWTSSNPSVATVDENGRVVFLTAGQATFTVRTAFRSDVVTITAFERKLVAIDAGDDFTCGFTALGRGWCWGLSQTSQTASEPDSTCFPPIDQLERPPCIISPKRMNRPEIQFTAISAGGNFGCGIATDQMIRCWGSDSVGQIGYGGKGTTPNPSLATVKQERFTSLTAGWRHACAINLGGIAYCWGQDDRGQLGDNRNINSTTPIPVADTTLRFRVLSAGGRHTCGLTDTGAAYCWGSGSLGQLGNGQTIDRAVPTLVSGGFTWVAISAGGSHTCGIDSSGAVRCWGDASNGRLGNGNLNGMQLVPAAALGPTGYSAISAGEAHTCGINAGTVLCWGLSDWGQVGDGIVSGHDVPIPTAIPVFQATSISAGAKHTCAMQAVTGIAFCWGSNRWGALGNEYQAALRATPQVVARPR
jgi:alpha-tubulin suppressor-like RCC1 family protein